MDLNKMVNDGLKKLQEEGYAEKVIEVQLKKTIEGTINDALDNWSPFGKHLKDELKNKLKLDLDKLDIASYNHMLNNVIQKQLDETIHVKGVAKMKDKINQLLQTAKEEYKLSELVEIMKTDHRRGNDHGAEISMYIEKGSYGLTTIYMDPEEDVSKYSCKYRIDVHHEYSKVFSIEINGKKFDNMIIMGGLYSFDEKLFKIYANDSKIIIDENEVYCEYEDDEDED